MFGLPADLQVTTQSQLFERVRFHPDDEPRLQQMRRDVEDPSVARLDYEYRIVLPGSGELRWILTRAQCFRDDAGQVLRVAPPQAAAVAQATPGVVTRPVAAPSVAPVVAGAAPAAPTEAPAAAEGAQARSRWAGRMGGGTEHTAWN